ncbi:cytochrome c oxidase subunit 5B, mitochondrial-like [Oscarella lobularis]|uniref:cytochrome c oxidase subunit 5B, mitochondrial-like n=1 Tax=Oscarella lobularis TaxID=121494 RepID=UPI003313AEEC
MALFHRVFRFSLPLLNRSISTSSARWDKTPEAKLGVSGDIPSDTEQATGLDKNEHDALMAGVEDPFNMSINVIDWGTRANPKKVPSMFDERLVGCVCEPDAVQVLWMKLTAGPPQRCSCGHWFVLTKGNPNKIEMA